MPRSIVRRRAPLALALLSASLPLAAESFVLEAVEWSRPRSGGVIATMPALRAAVRTWEQTPNARLVIRHPRGEAGVLWAAELRDWLVAMGLPSADLGVRADRTLAERVELVVTPDTGEDGS